MKKLFAIFLIVCLMTSVFGQGQSSVKPMLGQQINWIHPLPKGLVGLWAMNEGSGNKVFDLSGNGNTGILTGTLPWVPGESGPALDFAAANNWVNCGHNSCLNLTTEMSIIVKHYPVHTTNLTLVGKEGKLAYWFNTYGTYQYQWYSNNVAVLSSNNAFNITAWNVAAVVYDGININFYNNGVFINSSAAGAPNSKPTDDLYFGIDPRDETGLDYTGKISYVMIFNHALTASEIGLLYREPFCMFERDDVALLEAAIPAVEAGSQVIIIQMGMISLFLIPALLFIKRR